MVGRPTYHPGLAALLALLLLLGVVLLVAVQLRTEGQADAPPETRPTAAEPEAAAAETARHVAKPARVKALYVTTATAGGDALEGILGIADRTEINALVVDLKDDSGAPGFRIADPRYRDVNREKATMGALASVADAGHAHGLYLIARLPVFQDSWFADRHPELALQRRGGGLWRDNRGIRWLDPTAEGVWEYNAVLAEEAFAAGFDEIQLDYVRFASDGNLTTIVYPSWDGAEPKPEALARFFAWMAERLRGQGIPLSADLFGYTFRVEDGYDLGIGQRLAPLLPHLDFVSPMVYPSHYPSGHLGLANPAAHPGPVVADALADGQTIIDAVRPEFRGVRPWLQDFDLGADYTPAMVRAQIDAAEAHPGTDGWMLWNARNVYTESALKPE